MEELIERQIALETESVEEAQRRYKRNFDLNFKTGHTDRNVPESLEMQRAAAVVALSVRKWRKTCKKTSIKNLVKPISPEAIALISINSILSGFTLDISRQAVAIGLADHLLLEARKEAWKKQPESRKQRMNRAWRIKQQLEKNSVGRRLSSMRKILSSEGMPSMRVPKNLKVSLGISMIDLVLTSCDLFEVRMVRKNSKSQPIPIVAPSASFLERLTVAHIQALAAARRHKPMISPPLPWTNHTDGGYYTYQSSIFLGAKHVGEKVGLGDVFLESINTLQATAYRINKEVLEVLEPAWDLGLGKLPAQERKEPATIDPTRREIARTYEAFRNLNSKRVVLSEAISQAHRFKGEKAIYFPWVADTRGRKYQLPKTLDIQGADWQKALLEYSEGFEIGPDDGPLLLKGHTVSSISGPQALMIHGANVWGEDKATVDARIGFVRSHRAEIMQSAQTPLDFHWWCKADKPFMFLAFCLEWAEYLESGQSPLFKTRIPIFADGKCNGLQHLSAALKDSIGGVKVCLTAQDEPEDIYGEVGERSAAYVETDTTVEAHVWRGKVDRGIAKRNTMTLCYGATLPGFVEQLITELRERAEKTGKSYLGDDVSSWKACKYMAEVNYKSMLPVVPKALEALGHVRAIGKEATGALHWTAPNGLRVCQDYRKSTRKRVDTLTVSGRVQATLKEITPECSQQKHMQALPPNIIHSLDAAHMDLTVTALKNEGVPVFSAVHDSFGTAAPFVGAMQSATREQFVKMYEADVFNGILEELGGEPLERGSLDLQEIKRSLYFFM